MASNVVYDAIKTYLQAEWTETGIQWENDAPCTMYAADGSPIPWLMIEMSGNVYGQQSIGAGAQEDNRWDEDGQLFGHVFIGAGKGSSEARRLSKAFADKFRGTLLLDDNLEFGDASIGTGGKGDESGSWYRISVSIDWMHTEA